MIDTSQDKATVASALDSLFAARGLALAGAAESDVVIDELDRWRIPQDGLAAFSLQTFNLVVVPQKSA